MFSKTRTVNKGLATLDEEQMEYLEETIVAEFNRKSSFAIRATIVDDFAESLEFDWRTLFK